MIIPIILSPKPAPICVKISPCPRLLKFYLIFIKTYVEMMFRFLRRLRQGEILTQIGAGFGLRIMGIIIKKTESLRKSSYNVVYVIQ